MVGKDHICDDCFADWILQEKKEIMEDPTSIGLDIDYITFGTEYPCNICQKPTTKYYVYQPIDIKCPVCQKEISVYYYVDKVSCHNHDCSWNGNLYK